MSVEEHLYYYARIKGIPKENIRELVEEAITELDLQIHRTKPAGTLSGGNKRKLAVAMAIVGRPPIILLDEPSAGMDPEARRFMWSVVAKIASNKTSAVILTTHSMEEAEALSTKMGIMVKGGIFKCFGSAQHIRHKYGQGYIVEIKIKHPTKDDIDRITSEFDSAYSSLKGGNDLVEANEMADQLKKQKLPKFVLETIDLKDSNASELLSSTGQPNLIRERRRGSSGSESPDSDQTRNTSRIQAVHETDQSVEESKQISVHDVAYQIFTQTKMCGVLTEMCRVYDEVELLEKYGSYMKIRVTKGQSLGTLFGLVESIKGKYMVSDYSVSQTTLEQIFQSFANLKFDESIQRYTIDAASGELVRLERDPNLVENLGVLEGI